MKISLIISIIILLFAIILYFLFFKNKKKLKISIFFALTLCIILISILIFPLLDYNNLYLRSFASFIYAIRSIGMGQELGVLLKIDLNSISGYIYFIFLNILFLITPSLTIGFIVTYLEKVFYYIKFILSKKKKIVIFSSINEKSLLIAKSLNNKDNIIVFLDVKDKIDIDIKAIKLNKKVTDIKFSSNSNITFYMIKENEEQNLNETLELINKYRDYDNIKIYVINKTEETPIILDSIDKGNISLEIINETERAIFNLLNSKPLFLNTINDTISILIVGCGNIGKEFLKSKGKIS